MEWTLRYFQPTDLNWLVDQHQKLYERDEGFDTSFGPLVCSIVQGFLDRPKDGSEAGWVAVRDGQPLGSIFCMKHTETTAKLRLFLVLPDARGIGLGAQLLRRCMSFAKSAGYRDMQLWTHESHRAACALYQSAGWQLSSSKPVHSFGVDLVEQIWRIDL